MGAIIQIVVVLTLFCLTTVTRSTLLEKLCHGENDVSLPYCIQARKRFGYPSTPAPDAVLRIVREEASHKPAPTSKDDDKKKEEGHNEVEALDGNSTIVDLEDPSCVELRTEYSKLCFTKPPLLAFVETKAFCDAYVKSCTSTLTTNFYTNIKKVEIDYTSYCRRNKVRFEYVCPNPLRFTKYAEQTTSFCPRYHKRCPDVVLPSEPIEFKKPRKERIYTRELKYWCDLDKRFARTYCTNKEILKLPRYALRCAYYKHICIDTLSYVIYG